MNASLLLSLLSIVFEIFQLIQTADEKPGSAAVNGSDLSTNEVGGQRMSTPRPNANSEDDSNNNNLGRTEDVTRQIHDEQVTNILEQPQQQLNNPSSPIRTSADTPHNRGKRPRMNNESPEPSDAFRHQSPEPSFRHQKASKLHGSWTSSDSNSGSGNKSPEALKLGSEIHQNICTICLSPFFGNERKSELEHLPCSHSFHRNCIFTWIRNHSSDGKSPNCPLCRVRISAHSVIPIEPNETATSSRPSQPAPPRIPNTVEYQRTRHEPSPTSMARLQRRLFDFESPHIPTPNHGIEDETRGNREEQTSHGTNHPESSGQQEIQELSRPGGRGRRRNLRFRLRRRSPAGQGRH